MANVLIVDDEKKILLLVKHALEKVGHSVTCCSSSTELGQQDLSKFNLLLLDVMMPGKDGFTLCQEIRDKVDCPILFLTAKSLEEDVEFGFSIGADDYIKKPFSIVELRARVAAHLRREQRTHTQVLNLGEIRFLLQSKEIYVGNDKLNVTKSEYAICELLAKRRPQVFSKEQIFEAVYGFEKESDESAIKEHIKNIRKKFSLLNSDPIETVWGIGYRWH